jgi:MarR family transcriptional regulator, organic hydroperoxide resistance regulator
MNIRRTLVRAEQPSEALLRLMFDAANLGNNKIHDVLTAVELTDTEAGVLWLLTGATSPVPMRKVAGAIGCDPSNVTLVSDRLERRGLIERQRDKADGRVRVLALTVAGKQLWSTTMAEMLTTSPLAKLTTDEQHQLTELLEALTLR